MAQFTNKGAGSRGIVMKDKTTVWVGVGETVELNKADVAKVHEDIAEGAKAAKEVEKAEEPKS